MGSVMFYRKGTAMDRLVIDRELSDPGSTAFSALNPSLSMNSFELRGGAVGFPLVPSLLRPGHKTKIRTPIVEPIRIDVVNL